MGYLLAKPARISYFCRHYEKRLSMASHIVISKGAELLRIPADKLMYVQADGNYSIIVTKDGKQKTVTIQLGVIMDTLFNTLDENSQQFLRIGRTLIINMDYLFCINTQKKKLVISDCEGFYKELEASKEVLVKLKEHVESKQEKDETERE